MQLRDEQRKRLNAMSETAYLDRLMAFVKENTDPEESCSVTRATCANLMKRAGAYQFVTEFEVAVFVVCGVVFGADFDSRADGVFKRILQESDTAPRLKAAQMVRVLEESEDETTAIDG